jgi:hypothetical protein
MSRVASVRLGGERSCWDFSGLEGMKIREENFGELPRKVLNFEGRNVSSSLKFPPNSQTESKKREKSTPYLQSSSNFKAIFAFPQPRH